MSNTAIKIEDVSKKYLIQHKSAQRSGDGLRHAIQEMVCRPWRRLETGSSDQPLAATNSQAQETFWALKNITFEVKKGEVVGILGKNGAGKSTLLKVLSRISEPSSGRIGIKGRIASLLEVGTGFHPELTGRENIYLNGAILGMSRAEVKRKFDEIVDFSGVEKFLDTPVKRYSSGMYVRLAFSVAAHLEPEILIVDEVLAVGDAEFQKKCLGKMENVASCGRTVLFVSHNLAAVNALCSRALLLNKGVAVEDGRPNDVIHRYLNHDVSNGVGRFTPHSRTGSGIVRISDISATSLEDEPLLVCGKGLKLTLSYQSTVPDLRLRFLVGIYDNNGNRILFLDSAVDPGMNRIYPPNGSVNLLFGQTFSLAPGRYNLNVAILIGEERTDYLTNCYAFDVLAGDFFASGIQSASSGMVLIKNEWEILHSPQKIGHTIGAT